MLPSQKKEIMMWAGRIVGGLIAGWLLYYYLTEKWFLTKSDRPIVAGFGIIFCIFIVIYGKQIGRGFYKFLQVTILRK